MTVAAGTALTNIPNTFSIGPYKLQIMDAPIVSGNTSLTATADRMDTVLSAVLCANVTQTSVVTFSTNVATFTFTDPAATVKGHVLLIGT